MIDLTPLLKRYVERRRRRIEQMPPPETQRTTLLTLLRWAAKTKFGCAHGFDHIRTIEEFQHAVPVATYEDFWRDWWRDSFPDHRNITSPGRTKWFALTSGTTSGTTKYLPVTKELLASNRRAAIDLTTYHLANHPNSRPLSGKIFLMGSSTDLNRLAPGVFSGFMSGISVKTLSQWTRPFVWPPVGTARLLDWEQRMERFVEEGFQQPITVWVGMPSWMLILLERMREVANGRQPFPRLQLLVHGGVAWELYRRRFSDLLTETGATTRETYAASEAFIAIQDRGEGEGMRLNLDNGVFHEFIPLEELGEEKPTRHWVGNLETGQDYAIVLTSCAGLYAYLIGDTVRFVDRDPPRLKITGRTSYVLSAFGEHVIGDELDRAVNEAAAEQAIAIEEYSVGPVLPEGGDGRGRHIYLIGTAGKPNATQLALRIDEVLYHLNDGYRALRQNGTVMDAPEVRLVRAGVFLRWMAAQDKLGGQHKVPRVITDPKRFAAMLSEFELLDAR